MKKRAFISMLLLVAASTAPHARAAEALDCKMRFNLSSWSLIYKHISGKGTVTCNNGQTMKVKLSANGAGLTAGESHIDDGTGSFTDLHAITDVLGTYAQANANTVIKAGDAQVLTKGTVSLGLAGTGKGIEMGISIGELTISEDK